MSSSLVSIRRCVLSPAAGPSVAGTLAVSNARAAGRHPEASPPATRAAVEHARGRSIRVRSRHAPGHGRCGPRNMAPPCRLASLQEDRGNRRVPARSLLRYCAARGFRRHVPRRPGGCRPVPARPEGAPVHHRTRTGDVGPGLAPLALCGAGARDIGRPSLQPAPGRTPFRARGLFLDRARPTAS